MRRLGRCALLLWLAAATALAGGLTVDDVIALKELGYSEIEIRKEAEKTGTVLRIGAEDRARLKAAGLSDGLIAALAAGADVAAEPRLTVDGVVARVRRGESVERVLDAIAASGVRFRIEPAQALSLARRGIPRAILLALKGDPLRVADLRRLAKVAEAEGVTAAAWTRLADLLGVERAPLAAADALALVRAGVPRAIVARLREGTPPSAAAAPEHRTEGRPTAAKRGGELFATRPATPGTYAHVGRRFVLRYPKEWHLYRALDESETSWYVSPQAGATRPDELRTSVELYLLPVPPASALQQQDAAGILKHFLPAIRAGEPGLRAQGDPARARAGGLDAATLTFQGTLKDHEGQFEIEVFLAEDDDVVFVLAATAPRAEFARLRPAFHKVVDDSTLGAPRQKRLDRSLEARHVVQRYKGSVVSVVTPGGTGSGFIVSRDGYVLTNWHVVWDAEKNKPLDDIQLEWDESLRRPRVPAKLVDVRFELSVFAHQHGTDIALLKIPPGDYEPLPLTDLRDVEPGDGVVTLGFPSRGTLEGVSITITTGVVTRFNRGPTGSVETIFTDAAITHGSSGGPCVSLVTGGVIGLNTFGTDVRLEQASRHLNDLINYFGVVPTDAVFRAWPLQTRLGLPGDGDTLDFFDAYQLSRLYLGRGSLQAAETLARRAARLEPGRADAHAQVASCVFARGMRALGREGHEAALKIVPEVEQAYQAALRCDPDHEESLVGLATLYLQLEKLDDAARYADRAIAAAESVQGHLVRAQVDLARERYDDALRHVEAVVKTTGDLSPDPYLLAGRIQYARKDFANGRKAFERAARIAPANLDARLGIAESYSLQGQHEAAAAEYQRILGDFRDNPVVMARVGGALLAAKKRDQGIEWLERALYRFSRLNTPTPEDIYLTLAGALEEAGNKRRALFVLALELAEHGQGEYAQYANIRAADLHAGDGAAGLASAHLRWARSLGENKELAKILQGFELRPLSLAEIKRVLELSYPAGVVAQLVVLSPLDFVVRGEADLKRLLETERLPPVVVKAILISQKQFAGERGQPAPRGAALAGTWVAQTVDPMGRTVANALRFGKDGQFVSESWLNGRMVARAEGRYEADANTIRGRTAQGETFTYRYRFRGGALVLEMPGGTLEYRRQEEK